MSMESRVGKEIKKIFLRVFFGIEIVVMLFLYLFGSQGLPAFLRVRHENSMLVHEIDVLEHEIKDLETTIYAFNTHSFFKEKIAREQLQMARQDDHLFYIQTKG